MSAPLSSKMTWELMNPILASVLNPIIASPQTSSKILKGINLVSGATTFNHLLNGLQQGWTIVDQNAAAQIYRSQPFNTQTLTLTSSAAVTVNIEVF